MQATGRKTSTELGHPGYEVRMEREDGKGRYTLRVRATTPKEAREIAKLHMPKWQPIRTWRSKYVADLSCPGPELLEERDHQIRVEDGWVCQAGADVGNQCGWANEPEAEHCHLCGEPKP